MSSGKLTVTRGSPVPLRQIENPLDEAAQLVGELLAREPAHRGEFARIDSDRLSADIGPVDVHVVAAVIEPGIDDAEVAPALDGHAEFLVHLAPRRVNRRFAAPDPASG